MIEPEDPLSGVLEMEAIFEALSTRASGKALSVSASSTFVMSESIERHVYVFEFGETHASPGILTLAPRVRFLVARCSVA